jgi:hypothetical protein
LAVMDDITSKKFGFDTQDVTYDVCVVGGGMAGLCAAIASARGGAKTVLVQDRPVLGGNASSEVRMWICGAHGRNNKETGILEEIQLENAYRNPLANYSIWGSVLYEKAYFCPNLTLMLNTTCTSGECENGVLGYISVWQMTSQMIFNIYAKTFIDCSGDCILAPITGAETRWGRESRYEFDEDIQPKKADRKTMGSSLLLQVRETDKAAPFIPPTWAYKFDDPKHFESRFGTCSMGHNYWWLEIGGLNDTIKDAESIRHELMCTSYGIWDYFKNRGTPQQKAVYENWELDWIGSLPGKRENRRYVGPHILTQNDISDGGKFKDIIAYGGWTMDDHHPAGLLYPGSPTLLHPAPSPYGIPYRSLYAKNVKNLLFAGRNISTTHAALSSTRVMATTSVIGQAAGTAAALGISKNLLPRELFPNHIAELQGILMQNDCWLPGITAATNSLTQEAVLTGKHDTLGALLNGHERPTKEASNAWEGNLGDTIEIKWSSQRKIGNLRMVLDSNMNDSKRMPCRYPRNKTLCNMPKSLIKTLKVESRNKSGKWSTQYQTENNHQRLINLPIRCETDTIRITPLETWGHDVARIFSISASDEKAFTQFTPPEGITWSEKISELSPEDLEAPEKEAELAESTRTAVSA